MMQISESPSYSSLLIIPVRWSVDLPNDCQGIIDVDGRSFLCCVDFRKTDLIVDTRKKINKTIAFSNSKLYDSLDIISHIPDWDYSPTKVVGLYKSCSIKPIEIYVDIGARISGLNLEK